MHTLAWLLMATALFAQPPKPSPTGGTGTGTLHFTWKGTR